MYQLGLFVKAHNAVLAQFTVPTYSPHILALGQKMLTAALSIQPKHTYSLSIAILLHWNALEERSLYGACVLLLRGYSYPISLSLMTTIGDSIQRKCHNEMFFLLVFEQSGGRAGRGRGCPKIKPKRFVLFLSCLHNHVTVLKQNSAVASWKKYNHILGFQFLTSQKRLGSVGGSLGTKWNNHSFCGLCRRNS